MMAAASPRPSAKETPESTGRGPRGEGYCLTVPWSSSMSGLSGDAAKGFERMGGHVGHGETFAHGLRPRPGKHGGQGRIAADAKDAVRQGAVIAGLHKQPAARLLQNFNDRAAAGLDSRNSRRHGLQQGNPLWLVIYGGDAEDIQ